MEMRVLIGRQCSGTWDPKKSEKNRSHARGRVHVCKAVIDKMPLQEGKQTKEGIRVLSQGEGGRMSVGYALRQTVRIMQ